MRWRELKLAEYDDRTEAELRLDLYPEIEWMRYEYGRKPGWSAYTFKELFGVWPDATMKTLTPQPASDALQKWIRRRDNQWKKSVKAAEQDRRELALNDAGVEKP